MPHDGLGVGRGRIAEDEPVRGHIAVLEGGSDGVGQRGVAGGPRRVADGLARPRRQVGTVAEAAGRHQVGVGLGRRGTVRRSVRVEPVAELEASGPEVILPCGLVDPVDPGLHAGQLTPEQVEVAGGPVDVPGHDHGRVAPGSRDHVAHLALAVESVRDDDRHVAVGLLLGGQVGRPRRQEAGHVGQEERRGAEDLQVAGPAEAFVALGTVGGDVDEVAAHAPEHVVVQPVEQVVGRLEPAGPDNVGAQHDRLDVGGGEVVQSVHLRVAEAVEGEVGLQHLLVGTAQDVGVGGGRLA